MKRTKILKSLVLSIAMLGTTAHASNTITCAEYAHEMVKQDGITWQKAVVAGSGLAGAVATGVAVNASIQLTAVGAAAITALAFKGADLPASTLGTKIAVYGSITAAAALGGYGTAKLTHIVLSNYVDVINLSDEVELGGTGLTVDTMINSIMLSLPQEKLTELSKTNLRETIRQELSEVIKYQPQLCSSGTSEEILKKISDEVKSNL
ncbi:MAG: hypothetical protein MK008_09155 [Bdellovibrionales bacterium]|nr:hypothetical protein [Bdellovibrionales bacterium]